jgi:hypothetical protein
LLFLLLSRREWVNCKGCLIGIANFFTLTLKIPISNVLHLTTYFFPKMKVILINDDLNEHFRIFTSTPFSQKIFFQTLSGLILYLISSHSLLMKNVPFENVRKWSEEWESSEKLFAMHAMFIESKIFCWLIKLRFLSRFSCNVA